MEPTTSSINSIGTGPQAPIAPLVAKDVTPTFNYKKKARKLIIVGIIGIGLSVLYFYMTRDISACGNSRFPDGPSGTCTSSALLYVRIETFYYAITAFIFSVSGLLLHRLNKKGLVWFWVGVWLVVASIIIPTPLGSTIFFDSLTAACLSIILLPIGIPIIIGVIAYFVTIIANVARRKKWKELFADTTIPVATQ